MRDGAQIQFDEKLSNTFVRRAEPIVRDLSFEPISGDFCCFVRARLGSLSSLPWLRLYSDRPDLPSSSSRPPPPLLHRDGFGRAVLRLSVCHSFWTFRAVLRLCMSFFLDFSVWGASPQPDSGCRETLCSLGGGAPTRFLVVGEFTVTLVLIILHAKP